MNTRIDKINNHKPINIIGNILICDELCNLEFHYDSIRDITLENDINNRNLILKFNTVSYIYYNGGDDFGTRRSKYYLKEIIITVPQKHYIKSNKNANWLELILVHESEDKLSFQFISVLLVPDNNIKSQKTIQYQLFKKFSSAKDLPLANRGEKK